MHSASGFDRIEVVTGVERRRRWSLGEKLKAVEETRSSGMSVSYVARKYGISPSLLFRWRKLMTEGAGKPYVVMTPWCPRLKCAS
jgi:transposase